jgi:hypothetical protein
MGLYRVTAAAVPNDVSSHNFNNKRNVKESSLHVSRVGPTESLDHWSFNAPGRMDFLEFLSLVSSVVKLLIDLESRGDVT